MKLVDLLLQTHYAKCPKHSTLVVEMFDTIHRLGQTREFAHELKVVKPSLQESLRTLNAEEKRLDTDYDPAAFWRRYNRVVEQFLDRPMVEAALAETSSCCGRAQTIYAK